MVRRMWVVILAVVLGLGLGNLSGCGKTPSADTKPTGTAASPEKQAAAPEKETKAAEKKPAAATANHAGELSKSATSAPAAPSKSAAPPAPKTADAAVAAVLASIRDNHPEALWDFLPVSMQTHLNEAVREFGNSVDAELWNRSIELLRKIVQIFEMKKAYILDNPRWKTAERFEAKEIEAHWDDIVGLFATIMKSELSDVGQLKKFDGREFLAATGAKVLGHLRKLSASVKNNPFRQFEEVKVTLKSQAGETAVVTIEIPGQPPSDHEFALLEGKWCPKSWVESAPRLAMLKPIVAGMLRSEAVAKRKELIMQELDVVEQGVDTLLESKTAKEFNDYIEQAVMPFLTQKMAGFGAANETTVEQSKLSGSTSESVTVVVKGALDDKAGDDVSVKLAGISDNTNLSVVFGPHAKENVTEFTVTPVSDVAAFAKRINFTKVLSVDAAGRVVTMSPLAGSGKGAAAGSGDAKK